jgi:hypothetical protein
MNRDARLNFFKPVVEFWRALISPNPKNVRPTKLREFHNYWRAFLLLPIIPLIFQVILISFFWFCASSHALAAPNNLYLDETMPYHHNPLGTYKPAYCLFTYDVLGPDDDIYTCKQLRVSFVYPPAWTTGYDPVADARYNCWLFRYSTWSTTASTAGLTWNGIIFNTNLQSTMTPPAGYNPDSPCVKKSEADAPLTCDINIRSIITGAFSNKFPLDLFTGFSPNTPIVQACPSFTISGQTFRLCYINRLTAILKYVLLLVFVISSVLSL